MHTDLEKIGILLSDFTHYITVASLEMFEEPLLSLFYMCIQLLKFAFGGDIIALQSICACM